MTRKILFLFCTILLGVTVSAQHSATATASTTAIIIHPVGTETSSNVIEASYQAGGATIKSDKHAEFRIESQGYNYSVSLLNNRFTASGIELSVERSGNDLNKILLKPVAPGAHRSLSGLEGPLNVIINFN